MDRALNARPSITMNSGGNLAEQWKKWAPEVEVSLTQRLAAANMNRAEELKKTVAYRNALGNSNQETFVNSGIYMNNIASPQA